MHINKEHSVCFSLSIVNDMLVCRPFGKFRKFYYGECLRNLNVRTGNNFILRTAP